MATVDFHSPRTTAIRRLAAAIEGFVVARLRAGLKTVRDWNRRRLDREAFLSLLAQEDWVYRDMGISRADVEWAAHLPLHVNASRELEKLRARNSFGR